MPAISARTLRAGQITTTLLHCGDAEAEEAVLFLHGSPGNAADWLHFLPRVGEFTRAIAIDLPGYGAARTFPGFDHRVEGGYREFLIAAIEALGLRRVHLVGHDFGVPWGLAWAAAQPERVASLTLIDAGALLGYRWHIWARIWQTPILGEITQAVTNRTGMRWLLRRANPRLPRDFIDHLYAGYDQHTRRTVLELYRAAREPSGMLAESAFDLPRDVPALVLWGEADPWLPARYADAQARIWRTAEVRILPGLGHWPFAEDPSAVATHLLPFLRRHTGSTVAGAPLAP
ncbi:alpha/beta fold hydrolase [Nocardia sp. NPDC127579]|uniref:alpha/beta fold hydrolase n=1 Tax=Nocardia sp. NPDC127579 TaxID=3345402 RepID=UPI0036387808